MYKFAPLQVFFPSIIYNNKKIITKIFVLIHSNLTLSLYPFCSLRLATSFTLTFHFPIINLLLGLIKMRWRPVTVLLLLLLGAVTALHLLPPVVAGPGPLPKTLRLERSLPLRGLDLDKLRARDFARARVLLHHRFFTTSLAGVVDFPVEGSGNPLTVG